MENKVISDIKTPIKIDGQTYFVTAQEAAQIRAKLTKNTIAMDHSSPPISWQGRTLING